MRLLFAAAAAAAAAAALLGLAAGAYTSVLATVGDNDYDADMDEVEEIGAILDREEHRWLRQQPSTLVSRGTEGSAIYWIGFILEQDLRRDYLDRLSRSGIKPNVIVVDRKWQQPLPIEIVWHDAEVPGLKCAALIQIVRDGRKSPDLEEEGRNVREFRGLIPDYPLDENCVQQSPAAEVYAAANAVRTRSPGVMHFETDRHCDDFQAKQSGKIEIAQTTKISTHGYTNVQRGPRFHISDVEFPLRFLQGNFARSMRGNGLPETQFMRDQLPYHAPENVELEAYFLNDDTKSAYCTVVVARQGENIWQDIVYSPKENRVPIWARESTQTAAWDPRDIVAELGRRLGSDVRASVEPVDQGS